MSFIKVNYKKLGTYLPHFIIGPDQKKNIFNNSQHLKSRFINNEDDDDDEIHTWRKGTRRISSKVS